MFRRNPQPPKSALKSKSVQGSLIAISVMLGVIVTNGFDIAQRNTTDEVARANLENKENIIQELIKNIPHMVALGASVWAMYGRFTASSDLYTPHGLPGPDKEELEAQP